MSKIKVEVTKTEGFTNRVLAHDGEAGLLLIDKAGVQEVVDHPRVRHLIATSIVKETKARGQKASAETDADADAEKAEAERIAAEEAAKAEAEKAAAEKKDGK